MSTGTTREQLLEALAAFAAATDRRDWQALRALLTDDARGYGARGGDAVVTRMQAHLGGVGPTQHLLGNHRLVPPEEPGTTPDEASPGEADQEGEEHARILSYARVHHVGAGPMQGEFYECLGEYDDTWVRRASGWLLQHRWFEITVEMGDRGVLRPAD